MTPHEEKADMEYFSSFGAMTCRGDAQVVVVAASMYSPSACDERSRHAVRRQTHDHERVAGHRCCEDEACGLRVQCC